MSEFSVLKTQGDIYPFNSSFLLSRPPSLFFGVKFAVKPLVDCFTQCFTVFTYEAHHNFVDNYLSSKSSLMFYIRPSQPRLDILRVCHKLWRYQGVKKLENRGLKLAVWRCLISVLICTKKLRLRNLHRTKVSNTDHVPRTCNRQL